MILFIYHQKKLQYLVVTLNSFLFLRRPSKNKEADNDCDMPEVQVGDDDTDLESFEREEQRMEEEAARVSSQFLI